MRLLQSSGTMNHERGDYQGGGEESTAAAAAAQTSPSSSSSSSEPPHVPASLPPPRTTVQRQPKPRTDSRAPVTSQSIPRSIGPPPDTLHARARRRGASGWRWCCSGARGGKRFGAETGPGKHRWVGRAGGGSRARTHKAD